MSTHFQRHETVPPHTRNLAATDQFKWSAEFEVPAIGAEILIRHSVCEASGDGS